MEQKYMKEKQLNEYENGESM